MAATSAPRDWAAFARKAFATTAAAGVALVALAVPASAHTPGWSVGCDEKAGKAWAKVDLIKYVGHDKWHKDQVNTVKLTDNGESNVLIDNKDFGTEFHSGTVESEGKIDLKDATIDHHLHLVVTSWDGHGVVNETKDVKACVKKTPPSSPTSTKEQPPPPPPSSVTPSTSVAPTTTTTAAVGVNANLAETGASIALPLGIGALLLVGGATLLIVLRKRKA